MSVLSASYTHLTLGLPRRDLLNPPSHPSCLTNQTGSRSDQFSSLTSQDFKGKSKTEMSEVLRKRKCLVTESLIVQREEFSKKEKKLVQLQTHQAEGINLPIIGKKEIISYSQKNSVNQANIKNPLTLPNICRSYDTKSVP